MLWEIKLNSYLTMSNRKGVFICKTCHLCYKMLKHTHTRSSRAEACPFRTMRVPLSHYSIISHMTLDKEWAIHEVLRSPIWSALCSISIAQSVQRKCSHIPVSYSLLLVDGQFNLSWTRGAAGKFCSLEGESEKVVNFKVVNFNWCKRQTNAYWDRRQTVPSFAWKVGGGRSGTNVHIHQKYLWTSVFEIQIQTKNRNTNNK